MTTKIDNFRKRASEVLEADMTKVMLGMSGSDWSVKIAFNIVGAGVKGAMHVIGLLIKFLGEKDFIGQAKFGCVVKLEVMFKSIIEKETVERIHGLIELLPNLNDICLQTYIEWDATFKYIIEKNQVHTLSLVMTEFRRTVADPVSMIEKIVGVFKRVNNEGSVPIITKLEIKGQDVSMQDEESVGEIIQYCPQLQVFSINHTWFLSNLNYFTGHRLEFDFLDYYPLSTTEMQEILTWANASQTLKVIKFRYVGFDPGAIAALRADIEKDKPQRTYIQTLIFERCAPIPECEAIKKIMDYRKKAFELALVGKEKELAPTIVRNIILGVLGLKLD